MQVGAIALEEFVRGERQEDVEIAGRAAADAGFAFAGEPNARAVFHPLGNVDRQRTLARHPALTGAGCAGFLDHLAAALTARAGPLQGEEALRLADASGAAAMRAGLRLGAGLGAGARAGFAGDRDRYLDLRGLALKSFLDRDFHVVAQVGAALAAAAAALARHAKQIFENVGEGRGEARAEAGTAAARALLEGGVAEAVIGRAFLPVFQDFVGFVDFLEADFALGIAGIAVRLPLHRELAEGRLQLGFVGGTFDLQGLVIAAFGRHRSVPNSRALPLRERVSKDAAFDLTKKDPHPSRRGAHSRVWGP